MDNFSNFAAAQVSGGYDASATSITVIPTGKPFPAAPFNMPWWDATTYATPDLDPNVEVVRVTAKSGNVFTITRGQEGTAAVAHNTPGKVYRVLSGVTAVLLQQIIDSVASGAPPLAHAASHASAGSDALTLAQSQVTGLVAALAAKADASAFSGHTANTSNPHSVTKTQVGLSAVTNDAQVKRSEMGVADGVATLDSSGKVPTAQLPEEAGGDALAPVTGTFTANGYTDPLPLKTRIVAISYAVSGGNPTGVQCKDESGAILAGTRDSNGNLVVANLVAGDEDQFEGDNATPYKTTFGRVRLEAAAWNGATIILTVYLAPLVSTIINPVAPGGPTGLALANETNSTVDATCNAVSYAADYEYQWSDDEENWTGGFTTTTPTVAKTITGLPAETLIYVQVRARNVVGNSAWSSSVTATTTAGASYETETTTYVGRSSAAGVATVDAIIKLIKNAESNLSGSKWSSLRCGLLAPSGLNKGTGTTLYDLTTNNRDWTLINPSYLTWATTGIQTSSADFWTGGQLRRATEDVVRTDGGAFSILAIFSKKYTDASVLFHVGANTDDSVSVRWQTEPSPARVRELVGYQTVVDLIDASTAKVDCFMHVMTASNEKLYQGGSATPTTFGSGGRSINGANGASIFARFDNAYTCPNGEFIAAFFFDGEISGADYATLSGRLETILGLAYN